jgi:hypothetical protein
LRSNCREGVIGWDRSAGEKISAIITQLLGELAICQMPLQEVGAERDCIHDRPEEHCEKQCDRASELQQELAEFADDG